jgi:hypothetical protein
VTEFTCHKAVDCLLGHPTQPRQGIDVVRVMKYKQKKKKKKKKFTSVPAA